MRLAKVSEFRKAYYTPDSAPALKTLRARIDRGRVPGGVVMDGHYYVDLDEFDRATGLQKKAEERRAQLESDPLLDGLV